MWILASDIDGTLTGDRPELDRLAAWAGRRRAQKKLFLILTTGRRLDEVERGFREEGLPLPDAVICQVGTEIYTSTPEVGLTPMTAWRNRLLAEYSRAQALSFLSGIEGLAMQPAKYNTELKTSCWLDRTRDPEAAAAVIRGRVAAASGHYQVVWSSGRDLDILPAASGKGKAIRFLMAERRMNADQMVVAGDSGNDAAMFLEFDRGIAVGNAKPELLKLVRELGPSRAYHAHQPFAAGVMEGLVHFGVMDALP